MDEKKMTAKKAGIKKTQEKPLKIPSLPPEIGGQKGPEPTRYGDWEKGGIISDF